MREGRRRCESRSEIFRTNSGGLGAGANQGEHRAKGTGRRPTDGGYRAAAQPHTNPMRCGGQKDMNGRGTVETGRGTTADSGRDRGVLGVGSAAGVGDGERGLVEPYTDPSLAKWVALTGGIVCAALVLSLPLLQLVTP